MTAKLAMSATDLIENPLESSAVRDHLVDVVERAALERDPFCHFYVDAFFAPSVFTHMLGNFPPHAFYEPQNVKKWSRSDGTSTRDNFYLTSENIAKLSAADAKFWGGIVAAVTDDKFKRAIFSKLAPDLARRFGISEAEVPNIRCVNEILLVRDTEDYEIKPHPDGENKIATLQVYLPEDDKNIDLGTSLYRRQASVFGARFDEVKRFPFLPNSAYSFAVSGTSWHGRKKLSSFKGVRNTLMIIFQQKTRHEYGSDY